MGSGAGAAAESVKALQKSGEKVGFLKVRLYKPFAQDAFFTALRPRRCRVLDRTKEPGSVDEPL